METVVIPTFVGLSLAAYLVKKYGTVEDGNDKIVSFVELAELPTYKIKQNKN